MIKYIEKNNINNENIEVTTYRIEGKYSDFTRPDSVKFTKNIIEDLARRDITINAIAYNPFTHEFIDPFNGKLDLKTRLIICVNDDDERFQEDPIRMMRAIRFSCREDFTLATCTQEAINRNARLLTKKSKEIISEELCKILLSDKPVKGINLLYNTGLLQYIIPELVECFDFKRPNNTHHIKDLHYHITDTIKFTEQDLELRLAALLHDIGKPKCWSQDNIYVRLIKRKYKCMTQKSKYKSYFKLKREVHFYGHENEGAYMTARILHRLKFNNMLMLNVTWLVKNHMRRVDSDNPKKGLKRLLNESVELTKKLILLQRADSKSHTDPSIYKEDLLLLIDEIIKEKEAFGLKDLAINGYDCIYLGLKGKEIGNALNKCLNFVIENPELNNKTILIDLIKEK